MYMAMINSMPRHTAVEQRPFVQHANNNGNGHQKRFGRTSHIMLKLAGGSGALGDTSTFTSAGKKPGLEIWRVEKLKLIPVPVNEYGKFYSFDAYVVLFTCQLEQLQYSIHFWQGECASQDETTVAAYKTVELENALGSACSLAYREVQGHETKQFMSYFKTGIRYIEGSMGTEPNKDYETENYTKRLYKIKGKHNCRAIQVDFSIHSLNRSEVFVLDAGWTIYLWIGPNSLRHERLKGAEFASQLRDDSQHGQAYVHVIEENWDNDDQFFGEFDACGYHGEITELNENNFNDWQHERKEPDEIKLFKVMDKCGKLDVQDLKSRPVLKKSLDSNDYYVLDMGNGGVFAWVGKQCQTSDTVEIWKLALEYLRYRGHPKWTPICRVKEGYEAAAFIQGFQAWLGPKTPKGFIDDGQDCYAAPLKTKDYFPDDGTGELQIWRVENFYMAPVEKTQYGRFFSADCYVVMYRYSDRGHEKSIIYLWQGLHSSTEERVTSAIMASKLDAKEINGQAVLVKVIQNKEPMHFLKIFENKMTVLMGGHKNGFRSMNENDCYDIDGTRLFQVRHGRVIQVPEKTSTLNTNDVFILETPRTTYMWHGKLANEEDKRSSKDLARRVIPLRNPQVIDEGNETEEFWLAIGGPPTQTKHAKNGSPPQLYYPQREHPVRLYHCTNNVGYFRVEEVVDFDQRDLFDDDIMILDAIDELYVWIGRNVTEADKKDALKMALDFIRTDPFGRQSDNILIVVIKQDCEWPPFIQYFGGRWQIDMWNYVVSYDDLKGQFASANEKLAKMSEMMKSNEKVFPLEMLIGKNVPQGVDPGRKEFHLSEDEFERVFQLTRTEYMKLPQWKRLDLKKKSGLF